MAGTDATRIRDLHLVLDVECDSCFQTRHFLKNERFGECLPSLIRGHWLVLFPLRDHVELCQGILFFDESRTPLEDVVIVPPIDASCNVSPPQ